MKTIKHIIRSVLTHVIWLVALPLVILEWIGIACHLVCRKIEKLNTSMRDRLE